MNYLKFLYDLMVYLTSNYSEMPQSFKSRFPEKDCVNSRLILSDITDLENPINKEFKDYE